jgi:hypothetical protein
VKIADFLWPRSREPVLRVPTGFQPGLLEDLATAHCPKAVGLSGFGRNSADRMRPPHYQLCGKIAHGVLLLPPAAERVSESEHDDFGDGDALDEQEGAI